MSRSGVSSPDEFLVNFTSRSLVHFVPAEDNIFNSCSIIMSIAVVPETSGGLKPPIPVALPPNVFDFVMKSCKRRNITRRGNVRDGISFNSGDGGGKRFVFSTLLSRFHSSIYLFCIFHDHAFPTRRFIFADFSGDAVCVIRTCEISASSVNLYLY